MSITLATLRPTYDVYAGWFRFPNTVEPNSNWSGINKQVVNDSEGIYEWLAGSPWFDDPEVYLCNSYPIPGFLLDPTILISVRAKAVPSNELLVGVATLRVYYYESEVDDYYTDFTLTPTWTTYQREIPFDWGDHLITNIRFKARLDSHASNLYISQVYFNLMST
jgi:hypothetical protein